MWSGLVVEKSQSERIVVRRLHDARGALRADIDYVVATCLWRLAHGGEPLVSLVDKTRAEGSNPLGDFQVVRRLLSGRGIVRLGADTDIAATVPASVTVLLLAGAARLSSGEVANVERYVSAGGRVIVLAEPSSAVGPERPEERPKAAIDTWLLGRGISLSGFPVAEVDEARMGRGVAQAEDGSLRVKPVSTWVRARPRLGGVSQTIDEIVFYRPHEVQLHVGAERQQGQRASVLAASSEGAYLEDSSVVGADRRGKSRALGLLVIDGPRPKSD
jgi:hypothetical protein